MRSFLTVLGIVIGVGAVIGLMSIGRGVQAMVTQNISNLGTNLLFVRPGAAVEGGVRQAQGTQMTLTLEDAQALLDPTLDPYVVAVAPGDRERVAIYKEKYGVPVPMLTDVDYSTHRAFGLGHWSAEQALYDAPDHFCNLTEETGFGFQSERRALGRPLVDDPWMQAGEFVVGVDGVIRVAYSYNYCEDYPDSRIFTTAARLAG